MTRENILKRADKNKEHLPTIQRMALKGKTDKEIFQKTGAPYSFIQKQTTKLWEERMKKANEKPK